MDRAISWPELIVLMAFGDGTEDAVSGTLRTRDVQALNDDFGEADFDEADFGDDGGFVDDHPRLGRVRVHEATVRVARRGDLIRVEGADGRPGMIRGTDTVWVDFGDDGVPTAFPRASASFGWRGQELLYRKPASRWEGNDFSRLTGPIEAVEFLGRPAWAFELAPPPHKPYPLQMVVDAATGLVLREANAAFGSVQEWLSVQVGADLPDELFVWGGPVRSPADHDAEHERDLAHRRRWLADRGITALPIAFEPELIAHEWDEDSGAFHARRPREPGAPPGERGTLGGRRTRELAASRPVERFAMGLVPRICHGPRRRAAGHGARSPGGCELGAARGAGVRVP